MNKNLISKLNKLKTNPYTNPSEEYKIALRSRILSQIYEPEDSLLNKLFASKFLKISAIIFLLFVITGSGVVVAAQSSNPGDALYEIKLASEEAALKIAPKAVKKKVMKKIEQRRAVEEEIEEIKNNNKVLPANAAKEIKAKIQENKNSNPAESKKPQENFKNPSENKPDVSNFKNQDMPKNIKIIESISEPDVEVKTSTSSSETIINQDNGNITITIDTNDSRVQEIQISAENAKIKIKETIDSTSSQSYTNIQNIIKSVTIEIDSRSSNQNTDEVLLNGSTKAKEAAFLNTREPFLFTEQTAQN